MEIQKGKVKEVAPAVSKEFLEMKTKFINAWGTMGSNWGISRSIAQVHAILLSSSIPMNTDQVMAELMISRGGANMNLRELIDWGLIWRVHIPGDRVEYFEAEKDPWKMFKKIAEMKKRKECDPLLALLQELNSVKFTKGDKQAAEFQKEISKIRTFVGKMDNVVERMVKSDENWFVNSFLKMILR